VIRIDNKPIPLNTREVRLFIVGVDAAELIPHSFRHHFGIGVDRIFYIDNNSTDNSLDVLSEYDRVHVWLQPDTFSGGETPVKSGMIWVESLMRQYAVGNWCLIMDTDELFVYPGWKTNTIHHFLSGLDGDCVTTDLIDMYSTRMVKETVIKGSFLATCPYTDRTGNCRKRVLDFMPLTVNMPLFIYSPSINVEAGRHQVHGYEKMASTRCNILHFKFMAVLVDRLRKHGHKMSQSALKSVVYKDIGDVNFYDPEISVRYECIAANNHHEKA